MRALGFEVDVQASSIQTVYLQDYTLVDCFLYDEDSEAILFPIVDAYFA